jgi:hypothetical protein
MMMTQQPTDREPSLSALVQMRSGTDLEIPASWLLLPLVSYLVWAVVAISWWSRGSLLGAADITLLIGGLGLLGLAASAGGSYITFILLNRCNEHCNRTRALYRRTVGYLETRATASGQHALLSLSTAEDGLNKLTRAERERSAILWALLALIPAAGWIFMLVSLWRLSRDFANHSHLEGPVIEDIDRTLRTVVSIGIPVRPALLSSRDVLGIAVIVLALAELLTGIVLGLSASLVLIFLTIGALSLFWIDLSIRDPIVHFSYHSQMETELMKALPEQ